MNLAPIDLVSAHRWERVTFTTYALSLSFFEAVVLDALIRGGSRQALILADVQGVRASLSEQGAQRVGKDYNVEPVAVSSGRAFHPKISVFSDRDESHVLVGSGNLTFNGWGGNVEVLEHLHPSFAADLRRSVQGRPANGNIRLLHNLDKSISAQLFQMVDDLGGATRLIAAAPFWDQGAAIDKLCKAMGLDHLFIHSHAHGTVEGTAGSNWPFDCRSKVHPILLEVMDGGGNRRLHAKAFEVMCKRGRILVSGSANGTAAALEEGGNVEACVVRIQRDGGSGWTFKLSEPPEPLAALDEDKEDEEESRGVLRAVLDGDEIQGEILTPAMSGVLSVFYVSSLAPEPLGKVTISDRRFQISAASLEKKSWQAGRLVIRVEDQHGRLAEGFVSVASFADISKRAGLVARRLMAVLNGTETPADVAAIMSWFYEDPNRLADAAGPQAIGGGGKESADPKTAKEVVVADLSRTGMVAAAAQAAGKGANANWSRFMEQIFAAFREKRGPFGRTGASGKGDDDRDDDERDDDNDERDDDDQGDGKPEANVDDPAIERSLVAFEKLFELMLNPGAAVRHVVMAFDLGHYICERLQPDVAQATRWLEKLIPALLKSGVPAERRSDVAAAVLALLSASPTPVKLRWARGCLLRLEIDLSGAAPAGPGGQGFQSVLPQTKTLDELWPRLQEIRTSAEQVRAYITALNNGSSEGDFTELAKAAEEAWSVMKQALKTKNTSKIIVLKTPAEYCPRHQIGLPTREVAKLYSLGIGVTKNCCSSVLLWPGD